MEDSKCSSAVTRTYRIVCWRRDSADSIFAHLIVTGTDAADCEKQAVERYEAVNSDPANRYLGLRLIEVVKPAVAEVVREIINNGRETGEIA